MVYNIQVANSHDREKMKQRGRYEMKKLMTLLMMLGLLTLVACGDETVEETPEALDTTVEEVQDEEEIDEEPAEEEEVEEEIDIEDEEEDDVDEVADETDDFTGFEQFLTIELGASIDEVTDALGTPSSTTTMDVLGTETTTKTWMDISLHDWDLTSVTFSDGYATTVMEMVTETSDVSLADFNEISNGMTEAEVFEILGVPYSVTALEILGFTSTSVLWMNSDFSSIIITFSDGAVSMTVQTDLQ